MSVKAFTEAGSWRVGESTKDLSRAEGDQILRNKSGVSLVVSVKGIEGGRGEFRMDLAYRKSTCPSIHPYIYLSLPPITHPSIPHLFIHPVIHLSVHPSIHPSIQLVCSYCARSKDLVSYQPYKKEEGCKYSYFSVV